MALSQVTLEACFIFEDFFTKMTLNRCTLAMSIPLMPIHCIFVYELEADITLDFGGICKEELYHKLHLHILNLSTLKSRFLSNWQTTAILLIPIVTLILLSLHGHHLGHILVHAQHPLLWLRLDYYG